MSSNYFDELPNDIRPIILRGSTMAARLVSNSFMLGADEGREVLRIRNGPLDASIASLTTPLRSPWSGHLLLLHFADDLKRPTCSPAYGIDQHYVLILFNI